MPILLKQTSKSAYYGPSTSVTDVPTQKATSSVSTFQLLQNQDLNLSRTLRKLACSARNCFTSVTHKKKSTQVTPVATTIKQCNEPFIEMQNYVSFPIISKRKGPRPFFVLRFSPEVVTVDVEKSLKSLEQFSLKKLVCTKLTTKCKS